MDIIGVELINSNFPKYGKNFYCLDQNGNISFEPLLPKTQAFYYKDKNGKLDGDSGWLILEDFSVVYNIDNVWYKITCKKGFDFDFASIPSCMTPIVGAKDAIDIQSASLFHDCFYCIHHNIFNREISDKFLSNVIGYYNGSLAKQYAVYSAVRMFGNSTWHKDEKDKMNKYKDFVIIEKI